MPAGKVKWYDAEKGFGFLTRDDGGDVYVRASALPTGVSTLKAGQRVEFGIVASRRGDQALSVQVLDAPPSVSKAMRKSPEAMELIVEDLIKALDGLEETYRRRRHPDQRSAKKISTVLRALADELDR